MKPIVILVYGIFVIAFINIGGCRKIPPQNEEKDLIYLPPVPVFPDSTSVPYPQHYDSNCLSGPDYGMSVIYPQPTTPGGADYIISPLNHPQPGNYFAWPEGLMINGSSGAIDVTQSITGLRYSVAYVEAGTTDTCLQTLIIGGASYKDSIYTITKGPADANPYFDGNHNGPPVCTGPGPGPNHCQWDISMDAGKKKIDIDKKSGVIHLQNILQNQVFGPSPVNGATINTTIYYQLNDPSNQATQSIQLSFMYYEHVSDIPAPIVNLINARKTNINTDMLISAQLSPRPPLIIITRYSQ